MAERRELQDKYGVNFLKVKQLNKDITKAIRNDIQTSNSDMIAKATEENNA